MLVTCVICSENTTSRVERDMVGRCHTAYRRISTSTAERIFTCYGIEVSRWRQRRHEKTPMLCPRDDQPGIPTCITVHGVIAVGGST